MAKKHVIKTEGGEELVVLTRLDYDALRAAAGDEEAEDRMTERILKETAGSVAIPEEVWQEIEAVPSPIGPLRKWRGMTQEGLSAKASISQGYLSELETGKKVGDVATLRAIAGVLGVGLDDVTPDDAA